jgi:hypothetical protein
MNASSVLISSAATSKTSRPSPLKNVKIVAKKPLNQVQLADKMTASKKTIKAISVVHFHACLLALVSKYVTPIEKQIDAYNKSRVWTKICKLHAEKDEISGWNWDKKHSGVKHYWCHDPERLREIRNELGRIQRHEFRDGVKVKSMYYAQGFIKTSVIFTKPNTLLVEILDNRYLHNNLNKTVCRYRQEFVLDEEFYNDLVKITFRHSQETEQYNLCKCSIFDIIRKLPKLPIALEAYERGKKLEVLLAVIAEV